MDQQKVQKRLTIFYAVVFGGFVVFVIAAVLWANIVKPVAEVAGPLGEFFWDLWKAANR